MKKVVSVLALLALLTMSSSVHAAPALDFGIQAAPQLDGGTISYAGGVNPLVGSNIDAATVTGIATTVNSGVSRNLFGAGGAQRAILSFTTQLFSSSDATHWFFNGGGANSITIVGGVDLDNNGSIGGGDVPLGTTLLTGSFASTQVVHTGTGTEIDISVIVNTVNAQLATFYGLTGGPTSPFTGTLNLSFIIPTTISPPSAFTSTNIGSGDLITTPAPEPNSIILLGIGGCLAGVRLLRRFRVAVDA